MAILRIQNDDDISEFHKRIDEKHLVVEIKIEPLVSKPDHWGRSYFSSDPNSIIIKAIAGHKFGDYTTRMEVYGDNRRAHAGIEYPSNFYFRYSNCNINFSLDTLSVFSSTEMNFVHLNKRKPENSKVDIVVDGNVKFLRFNWYTIYSEIIRVNKRNKNTVKTKELTKCGRDMKILMLQGTLEQDGITEITSQYGTITTKNTAFGHSMSISLPKEDTGKDIEITDDTSVHLSFWGNVKTVNYKSAKKHFKAFNNFAKELSEGDDE